MKLNWTTSEPEAHEWASRSRGGCVLFSRFVLLMKVVVKINKAVAGSGHRDMPKYVGKGVALRGASGALGVPQPRYSYSAAIFRQFWVDALQMWRI